MSAIITTPTGKTISISPCGDGRHIVGEINPEIARCGTDEGSRAVINSPLLLNTGLASTATEALASTETSAVNSAITLPSENKIVDIMVLYSPQARAALDQTPSLAHEAMRSAVILQIGYFNQTLLNSGCSVRGRLAYCAETTWHNQSTTKFDDWNTWIRTNSQVASLRNQYGADLVTYITTGTPPSYGDVNGPYSVIDTSAYAFTHELGHNFGCHHNLDSYHTNPGPPNYAYGYYMTVNNVVWADIMSYTGYALPYYSNPNVYWQGYPLGDASVADNHRIINENAATVAGWTDEKLLSLKNPRFLTSGEFAFELNSSAAASATFSVEYTTEYTVDSYGGNDSTVWTALLVDGQTTFQFSGGSKTITDTAVTSQTGQRYYRAKKGSVLIGSQVGFYRRTIQSGYTMIGNHLDAGDNRLPHVLSNPLDGLSVDVWDPGRQSWVDSSGYYFGNWSNTNISFGPGQGLLLYSPSSTTLTFVGNVLESFEIPLGPGWTILASASPQAGFITSTLKFPILHSATSVPLKIARMTASNVYTEWECYYPGQQWRLLPGQTVSQPQIGLGESFWVYKDWFSAGIETDDNFWKRTFWEWDPSLL